MFPNDVDFKRIESETKQELSTKIGRSFLFDFKTGQHIVIDGKLVECTELQAIEQWLELLVRTTLDKYKVYQGTAFGTTWENYIGYRSLPAGFIESEMEREITEAAIKLNPAIIKISHFSTTRKTRGLTVTFTAELRNKEALGVTINV